MVFADTKEVHRAYESKAVDLHARVKARIREVVIDEEGNRESSFKLHDTTVGRALLSEILPDGLPFELVNQVLIKKAVSRLINECYRNVGLKETVIFADKLMYTGFTFATRAGASFSVDDMIIPDEKVTILEASEAQVKEIQSQYTSGLVTNGERYNKVIDIWSHANDQISRAMMDKLSTEEVVDRDGNTVQQDSFNPIFMMADSGARGSAAQLRQLAGIDRKSVV